MIALYSCVLSAVVLPGFCLSQSSAAFGSWVAKAVNAVTVLLCLAIGLVILPEELRKPFGSVLAH